MKVEKVLRNYRIGLGLTQKEMAADIISPSFYSRVESGKSKITVDDLLNILKLHKINISDFFNQLDDSTASSSDQKDIVTDLLFNHDLSKIESLRNKYKKDYSTEFGILLNLAEAIAKKDMSLVNDDLKDKISNIIFKGSDTSESTLKLFSYAMGTYNFNSLTYLTKSILNEYQSSINNTVAIICVNFLYLSSINDYNSVVDVAINYLKKLPNIPEFFMHRLMGKYYSAYFSNKQSTLKEIRKILKENGFSNYVDYYLS